MSTIVRIAIFAAAVGFVAGCERRSEEVVVAPPAPIQPEPTYNKF